MSDPRLAVMLWYCRSTCDVCGSRKDPKLDYCSSCFDWGGKEIYPPYLSDDFRRDILGEKGWATYSNHAEELPYFEGKPGEWWVRGECWSFVGPYRDPMEAFTYSQAFQLGLQ